MNKAITLSLALLAAVGIARAEESLKLVAPAEGETVPLLSQDQKSYLDLPREERVKAFADPEYRKQMRSWGYYPAKVRLAWSWSGDPALRTVFTVLVYRLPDHLPVFLGDTAECEVSIDNLEIAREYGWEVSARNLGAVRETASGTFRTEDRAPRLIRVPGVPNVRDLGGRIGLDGRRVRQGMVIRTAGLNDNASKLYFTDEELEALDSTGDYRRSKADIERKINFWKDMEKNPDHLKLVQAEVSRDWTVFRPADNVFRATGLGTLRTLFAIPETFLGAPAEKVTADAKGTFAFSSADMNAAAGPAVFFQEIEASDDGWFSLGCGADWYWGVLLDGEIVFDRRQGNEKGSKSASDWVFAVPVTKGRHLLTAVVFTGSEGWTWSCVSAPPTPRTELIKTSLSNLQSELDAISRVRKGTLFGKNRLNAESRAILLDTLGMKSDIDLRSDGECEGMTGSPMGPTVIWHHISSSAYGGMQSETGRKAFTQVFKVFLDPANYPIDFHCIAGQDRTGAVAFIVNGLLGVPEEELYLDWESTGFWNGSASFNHRNLFDKLVAGFDRWPGKTINERIEAYVLSLGFTEADIAFLRELLLEPAAPAAE